MISSLTTASVFSNSSNKSKTKQNHKTKTFSALSRRSFAVYKYKEEEEDENGHKKEEDTLYSESLKAAGKNKSPFHHIDNAHVAGGYSFEEARKSFRGSVTITTENTGKKKTCLSTALSLTLCATIGGFMFGYNTAIINGAMILIERDIGLSQVWKEAIILCTAATAGIFSLLAGAMCDGIGRKKSIMVSALTLATGSIVEGFAQDIRTVCFGRVVIGIGIGIVSTAVPVYVAECSPKEIRGRLVVIHQLMITIGILLATIMAASFQSVNEGWRIVLGASAIPAFVQFLTLFKLPESPRYLVMKGHLDEAYQILFRLNCDEERAKEELNDIKTSLTWDPKIKTGMRAWVTVFKTSHVRKALILGCSLQLFQQLTGINTVIYFSTTILRSVGFEESNASWLSVIPMTINFLGTFVGLWAVEWIGRRKLFTYSFFAIAFSCGILSSGFLIAAWRSPVTHNMNDPGSSGMCAEFIYCDTCLRLSDYSCGYCAPKDTLHTNGSCVEVAQVKNKEYAKDGRCAQNSSVIDSVILMYEFCPDTFGFIPFIGLILFMISFSSGAGPMPWTINTEIFPLWSRSVCYSITSMTNWLSNTVVSFAFAHFRKILRGHGFFFIFLIFCIIAGIYISKFIPETKGQALEIIEYAFMDLEHKNDFMDKMVIQRLQSREMPAIQELSESSEEDETSKQEGCVDDIKKLRRIRNMKRKNQATEHV